MYRLFMLKAYFRLVNVSAFGYFRFKFYDCNLITEINRLKFANVDLYYIYAKSLNIREENSIMYIFQMQIIIMTVTGFTLSVFQYMKPFNKTHL